MRFAAQVISIVFHPIIILIYILFLILLVNPFLFGYNSISEAKDLLFFNFLLVVPIPIISVLMLRALGFTKTLTLETREERIGPYIITGVVYLSLYVQLMRTESSDLYQSAVLGALIIIFTGFFINNFVKISIHAAAMAGLVAFVLVLVTRFSDGMFHVKLFSEQDYIVQSNLLLPICIICTGLVCTSRQILKAHTTKEVYLGVIMGFLAQLIAFNIVL